MIPRPPGAGHVTLPDSPWTRSHGSRGLAPLAYHGHLFHGTLLPSCPDSSYIPLGLPASLSHCPPLAVQLPHHSDRAPCSQRKRMPKPRGHVSRDVTLITAVLAPLNLEAIVDLPGLHQAVATRGARQWHHGQTLPRVLAPTGTTEDMACTPHPRAAASTSGSSPAQAPQARAPIATQRDEPAVAQHRWGGSTPNPPCCSPFGDANGVRNP